MKNIEPTPGCIRRAMKILGNKWTALIISELASQTCRFCELERSLGINPRTLSQRLDELVTEGIIEQTTTAGTLRSYRLTQKGHGLLPIIRVMADWGAKHPAC